MEIFMHENFLTFLARGVKRRFVRFVYALKRRECKVKKERIILLRRTMPCSSVLL